MANRAGTAMKASGRRPDQRNRTGRGSSPGGGRTPSSEGPRRQAVGAGNPRQRHERYLVLAREAASAGDAVEAENYYQHAEHYLRMANEKAA